MELSLISNPKPSKVVLDEPKNDSTINQDTIFFKWRSSEPNVLRYQIQIFSIDSLIVSDSTLPDTTYKFIHKKNEGQYKWQIRANNSTGWGDWSDLWYFQLIMDPSYVKTESHRYFNLNISPNPAQDYIDVYLGKSQLSLSNSNVLNIYNIYGESVSALVLQNQLNQHTIDISTLPSGIYFLQIGLERKKFIILR